MRLLSHPLRLDAAGQIVTVEQDSDTHAAELATAILSTVAGERALAPDFGIDDMIAAGGYTAGQVGAAVDLCEPDLEVVEVETGRDGDRQDVIVTVAWRDDDDYGV